MAHKKALLALLGWVCLSVGAQDITLEEMTLLDNLRQQYAAKGVSVTPENEARFLQRIRAMKALSGGGIAGAGLSAPIWSAPQQPVTAAVTMPHSTSTTTHQAQPVAGLADSELTLRAQLDALPVTKSLQSMERMRDGMSFNGQRYADAEGPAERIAVDPQTATAAYVVPMGAYQSLKIARLGSGVPAVTVGRLTSTGSRLMFQSVTGKTLQGDLVFPMTDGVLLTRDSVGFRYVVGEGVRQIDFPAGWAPAPLQRGNVAATGWLLLERDTVQEDKSPLSALVGIGQMVGVAPASRDYALFNMKDKRMVSFEIATYGKGVTTYSQCRKASNGMFNVCDRMATYDSIWQPNGGPNWAHYFWKVDWQSMGGKPVAVVMESGLKQINAYDLNGSKRVSLFERTMGIAAWHLEMGTEGKYRAKAQLAFEKPVLEDVALELRERADMAR